MMGTMTDHAVIRSVDGAEARALVPALAEVLIDCVAGGASIGFLDPLPVPKAEAFWAGVAGSVGRGERVLLAAFAGGAVVGTAQVVLALPENQPHRAEVSKVLVPGRARRRGLGAALMRAAEEAARGAGRSLLVLDTNTGTDSERLYLRLGWTRFGIVPGYARFPDGSPGDTSFFYKAL